MECSQDILTNDLEETVNKLHWRRYVQKGEVRRFHHGVFPPKHEGSNDASKVLVDINEDLLVTNSDNYVYSNIHCIERCFISEQHIPKKFWILF